MAYVGCGRVCAAAIAGLMILGLGCARDNPEFGDGADETSAGTQAESADTGGVDATSTSSASAGSASGDATSTSTTSNVDTSGSASASSTTADTGSAETGVAGICGDGILDPGEECDDHNVKPDDGCFDCQFIDCGNGMIEETEACDPMVNATTSCGTVDQNVPDGNAVCVGCEWNLEGCYACGDAVLDDEEQCEPELFSEFGCADNPSFEGQGTVFCSTECQIVGEGCCVPEGTPCQLDTDSLCCSGTCTDGVCDF